MNEKIKMTNPLATILGVMSILCFAGILYTQVQYGTLRSQGIEQQAQLERYKFLADTAAVETRIMAGEIRDYEQAARDARSEGYREGYNDGSTRMGVALMSDKDSFLNYSDGYHAALDQYNYQVEGLSSDTLTINGKLNDFEDSLKREDFDAAAGELTDIILGLEKKLEMVFLESMEEELFEELAEDVKLLEQEFDVSETKED